MEVSHADLSPMIKNRLCTLEGVYLVLIILEDTYLVVVIAASLMLLHMIDSGTITIQRSF